MQIERGADGPVVRFRVANHRGVKRELRIEVDLMRGTINVPATGEIGNSSAIELIRAIQLAADLADGSVSFG